MAGHEDWVQCLSVFRCSSTELLIASGGQVSLL
jgi:hypothetical protein